MHKEKMVNQTNQQSPLKTLTGHQGGVNSVSFSPDGKTLVSGSDDNTVKLWDVASGRQLKTLTGHQGAVDSVSFSPDGKTLVSGSNDETVRLWDVASGRQLKTLTGHQKWVTSVSFSPDGKTLVSGSGDCTVKLWDVASGRQLKTLTEHQDTVRSVSFSPDGKTLVSGSNDYTVKLWDVASGRQLNSLTEHQDTVTSVSFSPDGKTLVSGSFDETVKLWDVASGRQLKTLTGHQSFLVDGVVWYKAIVNSVSFSPDGKTLVSGSNDETVRLWDVASGRQLKTLTGHQEWVTSVSFSPDGKTLVSGGDDNTVKLWDKEAASDESFLNREKTKKRYLDWTLACTIGAGIGWAFTAPIIDIGFLPIVIEGLVRGAGVGFVLGLAQWIPLRQHFGKQINQWIQFSAAGYSVGFGLGILFFQNLYDTGTPIILVEALYGVSTGIALGIAQYFAFKPLLQTSHQWLPYVPDTDGYKSAKTKLNKTIMFWIFYVLIAEVVGTAIGWGLLGRPLYSISSSFVFQGLVCGGISGLIHGAITKRMITRLFSFLD